MRQLGQNKPATEAPQKDTSLTSAFMQGIDRPLENIGTTLQATGFAPEFGQTLRDATQAPANYESASDRFINPQEGDDINIPGLGFAPGYLPRAVVEQAGNFGGSLISRGAGATAGGTGRSTSRCSRWCFSRTSIIRVRTATRSSRNRTC